VSVALRLALDVTQLEKNITDLQARLLRCAAGEDAFDAKADALKRAGLP
jgi:hypothetical protein